MNSFLTGSQVYGKPRKDSDLDLVVLVSPETAAKLIKHSDLGKEPVRYGKLNLILCEDDIEFATWKVGTAQIYAERMVKKKPISAQLAKAMLDILRKAVGIADRNQSTREEGHADSD